MLDVTPTRSEREMYDSKTPDDEEEERMDEECIWTENEDGAWETECREMFELTSGTPEENRMVYCCYCGRPLMVKALYKEMVI